MRTIIGDDGKKYVEVAEEKPSRIKRLFGVNRRMLVRYYTGSGNNNPSLYNPSTNLRHLSQPNVSRLKTLSIPLIRRKRGTPDGL